MKKIILYFLFSTLAIAHIANSAEPKLLYTIGTASLFDDLNDVAVDALEQSYVLDSTKNTIYKLDSQGKLLTNWKLKNPQDFIFAKVLNSPNANLYTVKCVTSACKIFISKWSEDGNLITEWSPAKYQFNISKVVITNNNQVIINTLNKIQIYSETGQLIRELNGFINPSQPSTLQKFSSISNLAINSNNDLLIIDSASKRLLTINLEGKLLKAPIENNTIIDTGKTSSRALAYDANGFIYDSQIDYKNLTSCNCIRKFNAKGKLVKTIGSLGSNQGQFIRPAAFSLSKSNNLFVADRGNLRLQKISALASPIWSAGDSLGSFKHPNGLVADSKNNLYVLDPGHYRVQKFSNSGKSLSSWGGFGKTDGKFIDLTQITIDKDEKIYIQDSYVDLTTQQKKKRIQTFSTEGVFLGTYYAPWPSFDRKGNSYSVIGRVKSDSNQTEYFIQKNDSYNKITEWPLNYENSPSSIAEGTHIYPCLSSLGIDNEDNIYTLKCSTLRTYVSLHFPSYNNSISLLKINSTTGFMAEKDLLGPLSTIWGPAIFLANLTISKNNTIYTNTLLDGSDYSGTLNKLTAFDNQMDIIGNYPLGNRSFVYENNAKLYTINSDKNIIEVYNANPLLKAPILQKVETLTSKGAVSLKWQDRTNDETGLKIYRCKIVDTACTDFKLVKTTQANVTGTRLPAPTEFSAPSSYTYKVTTIKNEEESLASNSMTISF